MRAIIDLIIDILKAIFGIKDNDEEGNGDDDNGGDGDNNGDGDKGDGDDNGNEGPENEFIIVVELNISDIIGLEEVDDNKYEVVNLYKQDPASPKDNTIWYITQ